MKDWDQMSEEDKQKHNRSVMEKVCHPFTVEEVIESVRECDER